ncbi:hypothetical protein D3C86_1981580 [compost metagenome]
MIFFDLDFNLVGRQLLNNLHEKFGGKHNTSGLVDFCNDKFAVLDRNKALYGNVGVACCQCNALMGHIEFDSTEYRYCRTGRRSFRHLLNGVVQLIFSY